MAIVWRTDAHQVQVEGNYGYGLSIYAQEESDPWNNWNMAYYIVGGRDAALFDHVAGITAENAAILFPKGHESFLPGQNYLEVTIKAVHTVPLWEGGFKITEGTQTFTLEISDAKHYPLDTYGRSGLAFETLKTGDAVKDRYGNDDWTFDINSLGDGTGEPVVTLTNDAGGRYYLHRVGDIFTLRVKDGALVDYDPNNYRHTITVDIFDGTTHVSSDFEIQIGNSGPQGLKDISGASGATINEHLATGSTIGVTMSAVEPKTGGVTYSFSSQQYWADKALQIDPKTGVVTVKDAAMLSYEMFTNGKITLTIKAMDDHYGYSETDVVVQLKDINDAPVIEGELDFTIVENSKAVIATIYASDQDKPYTDPDTLSYSLGGTDAALFEIDAEGKISFKSGANYEAPKDSGKNNVYNFDVKVSDGKVTTTKGATVTVTDADEAPVVSGASVIELDIKEGQLTTTPIYQIVGTDPEGTKLTFTTGNIEAFFNFEIDEDGYVYFKQKPDFSFPNDMNYDNRYEAEFTVSDGTNTVIKTINIDILDVNNTPVISYYGDTHLTSATRLVDENWQYAVDFLSATDSDNTNLTWLVSGTDAALFTISNTGELRLKSPADYEKPLDANKDNTYEVTVAVSDGNSSDSIALKVKIEDLPDTGSAPRITSNGGLATASVYVNENSKAATTVKAEAGSAVTYSLVSGKDASLFTIDSKTGVLTFKSVPNFEKPTDGGANNVYDVVVKATAGGASDTQTISFTVRDVNEAPAISSNGGGSSATISVAEGIRTVTTVAAADVEKKAITYSLSGTDADDFIINSKTGELTFKTYGDFEKPTDADKNNSYSIKVTASDGALSDTQTLTVKVTDVAGKTTTGTASANNYTGTSENDNLGGAGANDVLKGMNGADRLDGGAGADDLYGGKSDKAADRFIFEKGDSGTTSTTWDQVFEFERGFDKIDLSRIDADTKTGQQDLRFVTSYSKATGTQADGQFRIVDDGSHVRVFIDTNGDNKTDMMIQVMDVGTLSANDFLL